MSFERRERSLTKNFIKPDKTSKGRPKILSPFSRVSSSRRPKRRLNRSHSLRLSLRKSLSQEYLMSPVRFRPSRAFYVEPRSPFFDFSPVLCCRFRAANDHLCPLQH